MEEAEAGGQLRSNLFAMSRQAKDDFLRHYTVSDPRTHPKGYTEYKVTAQVRWGPAGIYPFNKSGAVFYFKGRRCWKRPF